MASRLASKLRELEAEARAREAARSKRHCLVWVQPRPLPADLVLQPGEEIAEDHFVLECTAEGRFMSERVVQRVTREQSDYGFVYDARSADRIEACVRDFTEAELASFPRVGHMDSEGERHLDRGALCSGGEQVEASEGSGV